MVPESLLKKYKARVVSVKRNEVIFREGDAASHFFLVSAGKVKMVNYNEEGREFVQGYFTEGQSFGEPPFFTHMPYPATAIAVSASTIWKCSHADFVRLLRENFSAHLKLTQVLSGRLVYKSMMLSELAINEAEHRLTTMLGYLARAAGCVPGHSYSPDLTRQQLADMTGLRVETVIRTVKSLERKKALRIDDEGKIVFRVPVAVGDN